MTEVIDTAGLLPPEAPPDPAEARREVIKAARAVLRSLTATDEEVDDALEALVELSKG